MPIHFSFSPVLEPHPSTIMDVDSSSLEKDSLGPRLQNSKRPSVRLRLAICL